MAWSLVATTAAAKTSGGSTPAINTTGADLIVFATASYAGYPTLSDSQSNSWSSPQQVPCAAGGNLRIQLVYVFSPSTSISHTFSAAGFDYEWLAVAAFSGSAGSGAYDQFASNTGGAGASAISTGSVTPSVNNELVVAFLGLYGATATGIAAGGSFTLDQSQTFVGSSNMGGALAHYFQPTAGAVNPSFSWTGAQDDVGLTITFQPAATGTTVTADALLPLTFLPVLRGDAATAAGFSASLRDDATIPAGVSATQRRDGVLPAEMRTFRTMAAAGYARSAYGRGPFGRGFVAAPRRAVAVTKAANPPLESLATSSGTSVAEDTALPIEALATQLRAAAAGGLGAVYGPAIAYWGLRALNSTAAQSRIKAIQLQRASDSATQDITLLPSGGLDLATAAAFLAGTTGGVSIWYDQSGNGYHVSQATAANQPQFFFNQTAGGAPAVQFTAANSTNLTYSSAIPNYVAPVTFSLFAEPQMSATNNTNYVPVDSVVGGNQGWQKDGFGNYDYDAFFYGLNSMLSANNTWHSVQAVYEVGANNSNFYIDNTSSPQSFTFTAGQTLFGGLAALGSIITAGPSYSAYFNGLLSEVGVFQSAPAAAQLQGAYEDQQKAWVDPLTYGGAPIEAAARQLADRHAPVESLGAVQVTADRLAPVEILARLIADPGLRAEWSARLQNDGGSPLEMLAGAAADAFARLESLAAQRLDSSGPMESTGTAATTVTGDTGFRIEWLAGVRGDRPLPAETVMQLCADLLVVSELLRRVVIDCPSPVTALALAGADAEAPAESLGRASAPVLADALLAIEATTAIVADGGVPAATALDLVADTWAIIEGMGARIIAVAAGRYLKSPGRRRLLIA